MNVINFSGCTPPALPQLLPGGDFQNKIETALELRYNPEVVFSCQNINMDFGLT